MSIKLASSAGQSVNDIFRNPRLLVIMVPILRVLLYTFWLSKYTRKCVVSKKFVYFYKFIGYIGVKV